MSTRPGHSRNERLRSWLLLVALAPILTFMGHWPGSLPIPGTDLFVTVPFAGQAADSEGGEHSHGQHCHGDSDGCSDAPVAANVGLALLSTPLSPAGASGIFVALMLLWWQPKSSTAIGPELQPPRPDPSFA
jgi:hypothetical protein